MVLMPQIFDVMANENARYERTELECFLAYKDSDGVKKYRNSVKFRNNYQTVMCDKFDVHLQNNGSKNLCVVT